MSAPAISTYVRSPVTCSADVAPGIDVLCAGFAALDIVMAETIRDHRAGGTAANVAANLAWLGRQSALVARLGDDAAGEVLRDDLAWTGVDVTPVALESTVTTPLVVHSVALNGAHHFLFTCPECGRIFPRHRAPEADHALRHWARLRPKAFFYDRASAAAVRIAEETRQAGGLVMFEPSTAGRASLTRAAVESAHILKLSEQRSAALGGLHLTPRTEQVQIVTDGAAGLRWRVGCGSWKSEPAFPSRDVVDTAGAGDWTTAGLLATLLVAFDHRSTDVAMPMLLTDSGVVKRAIRFGQALAAVSIRYLGARGMSDERERAAVMDQVATMVEAPQLAASSTEHRRHSRRLDGCVACFAPRPLAV